MKGNTYLVLFLFAITCFACNKHTEPSEIRPSSGKLTIRDFSQLETIDIIITGLNKQLDSLQEANNTYHEGILLSKLGALNILAVNYETAINNNLEAIEILTEYPVTKSLVEANINLATLNFINANYVVSTSYYQKAKELILANFEMQNATGLLSECYRGMAVIYRQLHDNEDALHSFKKGLELSSNSDELYLMFCAYIGIQYAEIMMIDSAEYFLKRINASAFNQDQRFKTLIYELEASIDISRQKFDDVINKTQKFIADSTIITNLPDVLKNHVLSVAYLKMGNAHLKTHNYSQSKITFEQAYRHAKLAGDIENTYQAAKYLSIIEEKLSDFKASLHYHQKYTHLKDSLTNRHELQKIAILETKNEFEKEIFKKELKINEQKIQLRIVFIASVIVILLTVIIIISLRNVKRQKARIQENNRRLSIIVSRLEDSELSKSKIINNLLKDLKLRVVSNVNQPNTPEKEFIDQLSDYILDNISDENLSRQNLANHFNMSLSKLIRNLNKIASISPNELIRNVRLNRACDLLKENNFNITEVAYEVGFRSQSQFTKSFKSYYGISPSEFLKKSQKE